MKKLIVLVTLLILCGCQNNSGKAQEVINHKNEQETNVSDYEKHEQPGTQGTNGYSLGLYKGKDIVKERTFKINNQKSFTKDIVFGNHTPIEEDFILLVFDHGNQINFKLDKQKKVYQYLKIPANSYKRLTITIDRLKNGFHSVNYVILRAPNNEVASLGEAISLFQIYSIRVNIFKNIDEIPSKPSNSKLNFQLVKDGRVDGVFLGEIGNPYTALLQHDRKSFDYNLIYGNSNDKRKVDFYVVSLLNWKQIPINQNNKYIYDELNPGNEKIQKVSLKEQQLLVGKNVLIYLFLPNPYQNLPDSNPYTLFSPMSSNRITIK